MPPIFYRLAKNEMESDCKRQYEDVLQGKVAATEMNDVENKSFIIHFYNCQAMLKVGEKKCHFRVYLWFYLSVYNISSKNVFIGYIYLL